ncbi:MULTISPECIES: NAD(P)/FAD-dependent oxidoreductase [unclassified Streptomyces]|uniref:NAD(P)/FAD-dependent oxidoreductase n=1 Tax=unclassified Streptomyces TaxID=2593676 RepID=UPI002DDA0080|nr:FAD-dependent oxidoreductase [Streptomyces sp. NBC_01445]WSE03294.1 NAD(P)/FAD-dependent oxidoreductase [Streptomyces sp. NBC_01445]
MTRRQRSVDVVVVGAGPAGLAVARSLAEGGVGVVEILEREAVAGGVPRHCHHRGFGRWGVTGPQYAARTVEAALGSGARVRAGVTATGWAGPLTLDTTGPHGLERITARAVVLATGARERPRSARLVPGTRPAGVLTTGELQQAVHLHGQPVGSRAVVVGAEPVSYAALAALRRADVTVAALTTGEPRHQLGLARAAAARIGHGVPVLTGATVAELLGKGRVSGVRLRRCDGRLTTVGCDTVVFTGDFVPDHELARRGGVALDAGTRGPAVDGAFRTGVTGVFAAGNVLHAVEPALWAAREGALAADAVREFLEGAGPAPGGPAIEVAAPLRWVAPNRVAPQVPVDGFVLRTAEVLVRPVLVVTQDGRRLHRQYVPRGALPNRTLHLAGAWTGKVDAMGGPVRITVGGLRGHQSGASSA